MYENSLREDVNDTIHGKLHQSIFNPEWLKDINPKIILDVGAFDFGDSIRYKMSYPECEVHAFEMSPNNYSKFYERANKIGIVTNNFAISNFDKTWTSFYESQHIGGDNAQGSLLKPNELYNSRYGHIVKHSVSEELVETRRLDSYCREKDIKKIDLLHIDVEGFEYQVIASLGNLTPTLIFAEFLIDGGWNGQKSFNETEELLILMGYKLVGEYSFDRLYKHKDKNERWDNFRYYR